MTAGDVGHVRGGDEHTDQQTQRIDQDMAFTAADLLAGVVSDLFRGPGIGDTLRIEDRCTGCSIMAALSAGLSSQFVVDPVPGAVLAPADEPFMDRGTRWELLW